MILSQIELFKPEQMPGNELELIAPTSAPTIGNTIVSRRIVGLQVDKPTKVHIGYHDECKALCGQENVRLEGEIILEEKTFYYNEDNVDMPKSLLCKKCLSVYGS